MSLGDISWEERKAVLKDLLDLNMSVEDITEKYGIGSKVIYLIANMAHLDMQRRTRIRRMMAKQRDMARIIDLEVTLLKAQMIMKVN